MTMIHTHILAIDQTSLAGDLSLSVEQLLHLEGKRYGNRDVVYNGPLGFVARKEVIAESSLNDLLKLLGGTLMQPSGQCSLT